MRFLLILAVVFSRHMLGASRSGSEQPSEFSRPCATAAAANR